MSHCFAGMRAALVVVGALFSATLSSAVSAAMAGSCNNPAGGMCIEYSGAGYKDVQKLQRSCEALKSTFIAGAGCPVADLVGTCLRSKGVPSESAYRYYNQFPGAGVSYTREKVETAGQRQCTSLKGEWMRN